MVNLFKAFSDLQCKTVFRGAVHGIAGTSLLEQAFTSKAPLAWNITTGAIGAGLLALPLYLAHRYKANVTKKALGAMFAGAALTLCANHAPQANAQPVNFSPVQTLATHEHNHAKITGP